MSTIKCFHGDSLSFPNVGTLFTPTLLGKGEWQHVLLCPSISEANAAAGHWNSISEHIAGRWQTPAHLILALVGEKQAAVLSVLLSGDMTAVHRDCHSCSVVKNESLQEAAVGSTSTPVTYIGCTHFSCWFISSRERADKFTIRGVEEYLGFFSQIGLACFKLIVLHGSHSKATFSTSINNWSVKITDVILMNISSAI